MFCNRHFAVGLWMALYDLCERSFVLLNLEHQSFENIVQSYDSTLCSLFADNIYNRGRYYVADYFALFIAKRVTHVDKYIGATTMGTGGDRSPPTFETLGPAMYWSPPNF